MFDEDLVLTVVISQEKTIRLSSEPVEDQNSQKKDQHDS